MAAQDWAALIAGSATLVQAVATILLVLLVRRRALPLVGSVAVAVLLLMLVRRALAAVGWPHPGVLAGFALTHEATGLGISLAMATTIALLWRVATPSTAARTVQASTELRIEEVTSAREEERELLSYDLHDGLAQLVMGSHMHLDAFKAARDKDADRAERELGLVSQRLGEAVAEVSRIMSNLSLTVSPDIPLGESVGRHLDKLSQTQNWQYELHDQLARRRFPSAVETMTFRLIQEALNNAAKHARTSRVLVSLCVEDGLLVAAVRDWGRGFDPEQAQWNTRRRGLRGMCGRARLIGGSCAIESAPGKGTTVTSRVPVCPGEGGNS